MRRKAALLATLPALVLLAEAVARLVHAPTPVRRVYDPFAYRISQPDLVDTFRNPAGETVTVRTNELGLRGPRLADPVAPGTLTLVFLGGSAVENYGWNEADTFPALVGARVAGALGRPVRVLNGGQSAATSGTTLGRLQHQVVDLRPALVVVMDGINDLVGGFHTGFRRDGRHLPRPPTAEARPLSYLLDWIRSLGPPRRPPPRRAPRELHREDYAGFPALEVFARNLRSEAAIADAHGVPVLFLTQPTTYSDAPRPEDAGRYYMTQTLVENGMTPPDIPSLAAGMRAFNAAVSGLPAGPRVHVFDLAARVPPADELFLDECHFTKAGNARVAAELGEPIATILRGF
jgi:lysophospholipase L1-like esterase